MGISNYVERALGLGPSDEPRRVEVGVRQKREDRPVASTPGARVRIVRDGYDGRMSRAVQLLHQRGIPFVLEEGTPRLEVDGAVVSPEALLERVRRGQL